MVDMTHTESSLLFRVYSNDFRRKTVTKDNEISKFMLMEFSAFWRFNNEEIWNALANHHKVFFDDLWSDEVYYSTFQKRKICYSHFWKVCAVGYLLLKSLDFILEDALPKREPSLSNRRDFVYLSIYWTHFNFWNELWIFEPFWSNLMKVKLKDLQLFLAFFGHCFFQPRAPKEKENLGCRVRSEHVSFYDTEQWWRWKITTQGIIIFCSHFWKWLSVWIIKSFCSTKSM